MFNWRRARQKREEELEAEVRAHLDMAKREGIERGASEEEARAAARREFGNSELVKETTRDTWGLRWVRDLCNDVRFGFRMLRKNVRFSSIAIITIALGIGVNAAIFGLVDAALLNALPFQDAQRLVHIWTTDASGNLQTPVPNEYAAIAKYSRSFSEIAANGWADSFYETAQSEWQRLPGLVVTANWLHTLGIQPYLGRGFLENEQTAGNDTVVLLSYACWQSIFHGDREIVGKRIALNNRAVTVVGVMPQVFGAYPEYDGVQIIAPFVLDRYESAASLRVAGAPRVRIVARLRPEVTLEQARAELQSISEALRGERGANDRSGWLTPEQFGELAKNPGPTMQNGRRGLMLMAVAAGVVLLVACANVAALLLARGVKRQHEIAVRSAIGCSRARMIRQLLTENGVLFACGGAAGLLAARWSEQIIARISGGLLSTVAYAQISTRVFVVGLMATILCAAVFGAIPAAQMTRVDPNDSLKDASAKATGGMRARKSRTLVLVFQMALGMVLLVGFGLLLRSLRNVQTSPLGFDPSDVLTAKVTLPGTRYSDGDRRSKLLKAVVGQSGRVRGIESVAATDSLPMDGADSDQLKIERPSARTEPIEEEIWFLSVSPQYFSTLKIPMLAGRGFGGNDVAESSFVAIVNQTFAKTYFPGASPIGFHVALSESPMKWREIVGVVSDFRQRNPEEDERPLVYLPMAQTLPSRWSLVLRKQASAGAAEVKSDIGAALRSIDPQLYWEFGSMDQEIHDSESLTMRRPIITLLAMFAGLALVLIIVGVLGVTSYSVAGRTREIGIRVALGATPKRVVGLVVRESLVAAGGGLGLGALSAFAMARLLPTGPIGWSGSGIFLYGVTRTDALTYSAAALLLVGVVVAACVAPMRRALRVDPVVALRHE